jgi:hypothetical protein
MRSLLGGAAKTEVLKKKKKKNKNLKKKKKKKKENFKTKLKKTIAMADFPP